MTSGVLVKRDFYRKMLMVAIPIMLQNFIISFLNMVDTVMVGKLGEAEIAAVGIANQYFFIFNMILVGISAGCAIFIAQFWGKGDLQNVRRITGVGLISVIFTAGVFISVGMLFPRQIMFFFNRDAAVVSLGTSYLLFVLPGYLFTALTVMYSFALRSVGRAWQPMFASTVALIINILFNYLLIFGKGGAPVLGVNGAAIATVIARVIETILMVGFIYWQKGVLAAKVAELTDFTAAFWRKAYRTVFPVVLNDLCWGLGSMVYVVVYGRMGTQAVAAFQICNTVNNLFLVLTFGLSGAAAVMVGNSIGAGEEELGKIYAQKFPLFAMAGGVGLGLILAVFSPSILNFFNVSQEVREASLLILYLIAAIFFVRSFNIMAVVGILRGGGDARRAFLIEGSTMWLIGVPLTIIGAFVWHLPVATVYALAICEEICKCFLCVSRLRSELWIKNVTHHLPI